MAKRSTKSILALWLPLAFVATIMAGLIYGAVQQNYRQSANDPQIQVSEDAAKRLAEGANAAGSLSGTKVDIANSLSTFLILYDENGKVVASSAQLDGKTPELPQGVLDHAKANGSNRVTWEPKSGVRIAAVVKHYSGSGEGYVLSGRSLLEVEKRTEKLAMMAFGGWLVSVVGSLLLVMILAA